MKPSRTSILFSALPNLILLVLFYSLAVHMHRSLGGWPASIGDAGFPRALITHGNITMDLFITLLLSSFFVVPVAIFVCLIIRRWHRLNPYFVLYALLFVLSWGLMQLAPKAFLNWWWG